MSLRESLEEMGGTLPFLQLRGKNNDACIFLNIPRRTNRGAVDFIGGGTPPLIVDNIRKQRDALWRNAQRLQHFAARRRDDDDLISEAENSRPNNTLKETFESAGLARFEAGSIGTEEKRNVATASGEVADSEAGAPIARQTEQGVKIPRANQLPEIWIPQTPKRFAAVAAVGNFDPWIAVEERNIPLNDGAKFRVVGRLCAAETAVCHLDIEPGVTSHFTKVGRGVLDWMSRDDEDAAASLRH